MTTPVIATVLRLQVQRSRLKPGERGARVYDPSPLLEVSALEVGPRGVTGDGQLDVHHADHPDSRNRRLVNGLSLLPQVHYDRLRQRYGPHLLDGVAGESILLDTDGPWSEPPGDLQLETTDGWLLLTDLQPAPPCVEFSCFCLGDPQAPVDQVQAALSHLDDGTRGFYAQTAGTGRVEVGARLRLA